MQHYLPVILIFHISFYCNSWHVVVVARASALLITQNNSLSGPESISLPQLLHYNLCLHCFQKSCLGVLVYELQLLYALIRECILLILNSIGMQ